MYYRLKQRDEQIKSLTMTGGITFKMSSLEAHCKSEDRPWLGLWDVIDHLHRLCFVKRNNTSQGHGFNEFDCTGPPICSCL